jgi:hypothetical protein
MHINDITVLFASKSHYQCEIAVTSPIFTANFVSTHHCLLFSSLLSSTTYYNQFAASEMALAGITDSHTRSVEMEVVEPLARYASTVVALKASVTSQRNKRANHIAANSAIQRDSVRNPNHEELVAKADRCLNEYVAASNRLDEDYQRYQQDRDAELLLLLHSLASLQSQQCRNAQVVWTELEASLVADARDPPAPPLSRPASQQQQQQASSLLDLEEEEAEGEEEEGRMSDFYESV